MFCSNWKQDYQPTRFTCYGMYIIAKGGRHILNIRLSDWWLLAVFSYLLHSCAATKLHFSKASQLLSLLLAHVVRFHCKAFLHFSCALVSQVVRTVCLFIYKVRLWYPSAICTLPSYVYMFTVWLLLAVAFWCMFYGLKLFIYGFRCFKPLT